jgi:hypothetical protein
LSLFAVLASLAAPLAPFTCCTPAWTQSANGSRIAPPATSAGTVSSGLEQNAPDAVPAPADTGILDPQSYSSKGDGVALTGDANSALPSAPDPDGFGANPERENVAHTAEWHQPPFSRIGVGADVSLLGIGIKPAIVLNEYFDARGLINFFGYTSGQFEVDGFKINANLHLASAAAAVDVYPYNSIWRLSAGLFFFNGNRISAATTIAGGTSFNLGSANYYSSSADPVNGSAVLGLHTTKPAPMVSFGFGRFIPRSNRHWSFPAEFGVIYMGAPALTVTTAGAVCTDMAQTNCSDIGDPTNPVAIAFNSNLDTKLSQWREDLKKVEFYPIFSYSVVYSFNIR